MQAVSRQEYQGYVIQLTTDPWARAYGSIWEYTDGETVRGFETFAACVDAIDQCKGLGEWTIEFQWHNCHEGKRKFWYSEAIEFAEVFGKEVVTDWVNRKILVK